MPPHGHVVLRSNVAYQKSPRRWPSRTHAICKSPRIANQRRPSGTTADAHEYAFTCLPGSLNGVGAHVVDHLGIDTLGGATQSEFAQGRQIAGLEVAVDGAFGLFRNVD